MSITQSYTELRRYMEKWQWDDPRTGQRVTGFDPPQTATNVSRLPFYIRFLTKTGHVDTGNCVCLSVDTPAPPAQGAVCGQWRDKGCERHPCARSGWHEIYNALKTKYYVESF